tara:strand:- start:5618 stop:5941 length:324 start_codon:yes stop_codon:yes gene_type:complete
MSKITLGSGTLHQYTPSGQDIEGQINLNRLSDVKVTNVQDNQILKYNTTTLQWENTAAGDVTEIDLEDLTDVTITAVTNGQSLQYNSTSLQWENADIVATVVDGGTY